MRGSAFAFHAYSAGAEGLARRAELVFGVASVVSPFLLGVVAGAVASGDLRVDVGSGRVSTDFVSEWLAPFPFAIGLFNLAMCSYLAAVYMTVEVEDRELRDDFRWCALISGVAVGACALACAVLADQQTAFIGKPLLEPPGRCRSTAFTGVIATAALWALWTRRYRLARVLASAQTALVIAGWAIAQHPYLVPPDVSIEAAATTPSVLRVTVTILGVGSIVLVPAFIYLYSVFKKR